MAFSRRLRNAFLFIAVMGVLAAGNLSAQVLPVLNSFNGRKFNGTLSVPGPVQFDGCTFVTDSIVLDHSYGVVFRNCSFESRNAVLYLAGSGDGMILKDCSINGCGLFRFSRKPLLSDRNYIANVTINGLEWVVSDDDESVIDIQGLDLEENVQGNLNGPVVMFVSADKKQLKGGETANLKIRGLDKDMFVGWHCMDSTANIVVENESDCFFIAPQTVTERRDVLVTAYTECGLEAACIMTLVPDNNAVIPKGNKKEKSKRSGKRK